MLKTSVSGFTLSRKESLTSLTEMQNREKNAQQKEKKEDEANEWHVKNVRKIIGEFNESYEKKF